MKELFNRIIKYIKPSNIRDFIQGNYNYIKDTHFNSLPLHIKEQAVFRMMMCVPCLKNGSCFECGCTTPNMFYSPNKVDSLGRWKEMLDDVEWEKFKKDNDIKIDIDDIIKLTKDETKG